MPVVRHQFCNILSKKERKAHLLAKVLIARHQVQDAETGPGPASNGKI